MTDNIRILLCRLDVLKTQHKAGITPPFGELDELFDCAARAKADVAALDGGLTPPELRRSEELRQAERGTVAGVREEQTIAMHVDVPLAEVAHVVLREMAARDCSFDRARNRLSIEVPIEDLARAMLKEMQAGAVAVGA